MDKGGNTRLRIQFLILRLVKSTGAFVRARPSSSLQGRHSVGTIENDESIESKMFVGSFVDETERKREIKGLKGGREERKPFRFTVNVTHKVSRFYERL